MGGGKRASAKANPQTSTSGLSPATPQRTQTSRGRSQDRSPATGQPSEDGDAFKARSPVKPIPWTISENTSDEEAWSQAINVGDTGSPYSLCEEVIDNLNADFPEGHPCVWLPNEYTTRKWQQTDGAEATERLVLRVIPREDGNGGVWIFGDKIRFAVSDGSAVWYEHPYALRPLNPNPELAARLFSHRATSPSPRCEDASPDRWGWLTPAGLGAADRREVTVPRSAVPHLVGRKGQAIQQTENSLGVLIGIMDGTGNEATVTLIGPLAQVESARDIIATLAVGARSVLTRLKNPD